MHMFYFLDGFEISTAIGSNLQPWSSKNSQTAVYHWIWTQYAS